MNWLHTAVLKWVDLRRVDPVVLAATKRELEQFNARRKAWKS